jgi:hypothetical protein
VERAILTLAGIGEALSALRSHRLTHCASLARLAFYLFLVQTFTTRKPFIDPAIFRDRNFVLGSASSSWSASFSWPRWR